MESVCRHDASGSSTLTLTIRPWPGGCVLAWLSCCQCDYQSDSVPDLREWCSRVLARMTYASVSSRSEGEVPSNSSPPDSKSSSQEPTQADSGTSGRADSPSISPSSAPSSLDEHSTPSSESWVYASAWAALKAEAEPAGLTPPSPELAAWRARRAAERLAAAPDLASDGEPIETMWDEAVPGVQADWIDALRWRRPSDSEPPTR